MEIKKHLTANNVFKTLMVTGLILAVLFLLYRDAKQIEQRPMSYDIKDKAGKVKQVELNVVQARWLWWVGVKPQLIIVPQPIEEKEKEDGEKK